MSKPKKIAKDVIVAPKNTMEMKLKALKKLQLEHVQLEIEFSKEVYALEKRFNDLAMPLYEKRHLITTSRIKLSDEECFLPNNYHSRQLDGDVAGGDHLRDEETTEGVPNFWLIALKGAEEISNYIQEYDEPILRHLNNIKTRAHLDPMKTTLMFFFDENEFFTNRILTKQYNLKCKLDEEAPFAFEGPTVFSSVGCFINWKSGKNVFFEDMSTDKKIKGTSTPNTRRESFFDLFSSHSFEDVDVTNVNRIDIIAEMNEDADLGLFIADHIIPDAVLFYTREAESVDEDDSEDLITEQGDDDEYDSEGSTIYEIEEEEEEEDSNDDDSASVSDSEEC